MSWNEPIGLPNCKRSWRVLERGFVGAHRASGRHPSRRRSASSRSTCAVSRNEFAALQAVRFRHAAVLQRDLAVLDHLERDLVLDLLDAEAGRRLVLDDEALDLVVGDVARPDDRDVAPRRVADPPLLAVEDPGVALALRRRRQTAAGARNPPAARSGRSSRSFPCAPSAAATSASAPPTREVDRAHRQTVVDAEEGRERRRRRAPSPSRPGRTASGFRRGSRSPCMPRPPMFSSLKGRQQLERERVFDPVLVDDRRDLGLHELAHLLEDRPFLGAQASRRVGRSRCSAPEAVSVPKA